LVIFFSPLFLCKDVDHESEKYLSTKGTKNTKQFGGGLGIDDQYALHFKPPYALIHQL